MQLFETHAHLDGKEFDEDRDAVLQRAADAGVDAIITVGTSLLSSRRAVDLAERYADVYAAVGVHPHEAEAISPATLKELRKLASHPRAVAIGEIGLDFYRDRATREVQRSAFREQLNLASEFAAPVVVHVRDRKDNLEAYDEVLDFLRDWVSGSQETPQQSRRFRWADLAEAPRRRPAGVLHCFSGTAEMMRVAIDLGFFVGVNAPITYPNASALRSVILQTPLERLLLETDCPYLPPQPLRGRRNEPANLVYVAQKVAELKKVSVEHVASVTTKNAVQLFNCDGE